MSRWTSKCDDRRGSSVTWWLERDQVIQVRRLSSIEKFKGKRENFIFNTFIYFEPVKKFKNKSGMTKFRSSDDSTSKGVLDVLKTIEFRLRKIIV